MYILPKGSQFAALRGRMDDLQATNPNDTVLTNLTTFFEYLRKSSDMKYFMMQQVEHPVNYVKTPPKIFSASPSNDICILCKNKYRPHNIETCPYLPQAKDHIAGIRKSEWEERQLQQTRQKSRTRPHTSPAKVNIVTTPTGAASQ